MILHRFVLLPTWVEVKLGHDDEVCRSLSWHLYKTFKSYLFSHMEGDYLVSGCVAGGLEPGRWVVGMGGFAWVVDDLEIKQP